MWFFKTPKAMLPLIILSCNIFEKCLASSSFTFSSLSSSISESLENNTYFFAKLDSLSYCLLTSGWSTTDSGCPLYCGDSTFDEVALFDVWRPSSSLSEAIPTLFYVDHGRKAKIIDFRGSTTLNDWAADLSIVPTSYTPIVVGKGVVSSSGYNGAKVHSGFYEALQQTWDGLNATFTAMNVIYPNYKTFIMGHSLGGAVAQLAGIELSLLGYDPLVLSWGSPRIGNSKFVSYLNGLFDPQNSYDKIQQGTLYGNIRQVHEGDVVPYVPFPPTYQHGGMRLFINKVDLTPSASQLVVYNPNDDSQKYFSALIETIESLIEFGKEESDSNFIEVAIYGHLFYYVNQASCVTSSNIIETFGNVLEGLFSSILNIPFTALISKRDSIEGRNVTVSDLKELPNYEAFEKIKEILSEEMEANKKF